MNLVAVTSENTFATGASAPHGIPVAETDRDTLTKLRGALRRTRAASAMLADMQLVSNLTGVPALDALCIRMAIVMGRPLQAYAKGTQSASFDEAWLMQVFAARARDDGASYRFLLRSRLSPAEAADMHFLFCRASSALDS